MAISRAHIVCSSCESEFALPPGVKSGICPSCGEAVTAQPEAPRSARVAGPRDLPPPSPPGGARPVLPPPVPADRLPPPVPVGALRPPVAPTDTRLGFFTPEPSEHEAITAVGKNPLASPAGAGGDRHEAITAVGKNPLAGATAGDAPADETAVGKNPLRAAESKRRLQEQMSAVATLSAYTPRTQQPDAAAAMDALAEVGQAAASLDIPGRQRRETQERLLAYAQQQAAPDEPEQRPAEGFKKTLMGISLSDLPTAPPPAAPVARQPVPRRLASIPPGGDGMTAHQVASLLERGQPEFREHRPEPSEEIGLASTLLQGLPARPPDPYGDPDADGLRTDLGSVVGEGEEEPGGSGPGDGIVVNIPLAPVEEVLHVAEEEPSTLTPHRRQGPAPASPRRAPRAADSGRAPGPTGGGGRVAQLLDRLPGPAGNRRLVVIGGVALLLILLGSAILWIAS